MTDAEVNVSGNWTGLFRYPVPTLRPVAFEARLVDLAGTLDGETNEFGGPDAVLSGTREGTAIQFEKRYRAEDRDAVHYQGALAASGLRIDGHWVIHGPNGWSGTFFMARLPEAPAQVSLVRESVVVEE